MFRFKVAVTLLAAYVAVGLVIQVNVVEDLEKSVYDGQLAQLDLAGKAVARSRMAHAGSITDKAREVAAWPQLGEKLAIQSGTLTGENGAPLSDADFRYKIHQMVDEEVLVWKSKFDAAAKAAESLAGDELRSVPDLFLVTDAKGIGVADSADRAGMGDNIGKDYGALLKAIREGREVRDIWLVKGAPMSVSVAPVRHSGKVVGGVVLGYRLSDAQAKEDRASFGLDVGYYVNDQMTKGSSLSSKSEKVAEKKIADLLKGDGQADPRKVFELELEGMQHLGRYYPLAGYETATAGFIVIAGLEAAMNSATGSVYTITLAILLGFLLTLGLVLFLFERFFRPFKDLDQGVVEIINGSLDHWFDARGSEFANALAQNLNIMICQLTGRPLPEDDDVVESHHWARDQLFVESINPDEFKAPPLDAETMDTGEIRALSPVLVDVLRDDEDLYERKTFSAYIGAMVTTGEPMVGITFGLFVAELRRNAEELRARYQCHRVRFTVEIEDGKAALKPVPLN